MESNALKEIYLLPKKLILKMYVGYVRVGLSKNLNGINKYPVIRNVTNCLYIIIAISINLIIFQTIFINTKWSHKAGYIIFLAAKNQTYFLPQKIKNKHQIEE